MAKLEYVTPCVSEEVFAADEYVAACWGVACARAKENDAPDWQEDATKDVSHHRYPEGTGCGYASNQWIIEKPDGSVFMTEGNTRQQGDLECTITNSDWSVVQGLNANNITNGQTIYWITNASDGSGRTWPHYGSSQMNNNPS